MSKNKQPQQLDLAFPRPRTAYEELQEECERDPGFYAAWQEALGKRLEAAYRQAHPRKES